jgi:hypothetical protein
MSCSAGKAAYSCPKITPVISLNSRILGGNFGLVMPLAFSSAYLRASEARENPME